MADHHGYLASSTATPPMVPLLSPPRPFSFASSSAAPPPKVPQSPSLAKFRAPPLMVSKDFLSLSPPGVPPKVPVIIQSHSLAKFRAPPLMVSKDNLSLSPPGVPSRKHKLDDDDGLAVKFYEDQWKIKKKLKQSDINGNSRLLLPIKSVEDYILPLMGGNLARFCRSDRGVRFEVRDADESDESSGYYLVLKKWRKTRYFVLNGNWRKDFVRRKGLQRDDEVGLTFDGNKILFKLLNKN